MRRRPIPTWRAARPPASRCSSRERQGRDCLRRVARRRRGYRLAPRPGRLRRRVDLGLAPNRASDLVAAIEDIGRRAIAVRADSADPAAIRNAVAETVERLGTLDVAVVNAGVLRFALVEAFTLEDLDLMLDVNVRGVFLAIQASIARIHDGARVVTIGSNTAVRTGAQGSSVYAMTKAAVATMVKGIVQPGPTETDMTAAMVARLREVIPVGRIGQPDEIAAPVSYLAGPEAGYMPGASLTIDGGYVL